MSAPRRYRVDGVLGAGGFGTVFLAELVSPPAGPVALKVPNEDHSRSPDVLRRLRNEAAVIRQVNHRAVVKVERLALLDDVWSIVMEYIPGVSLVDIIRKGAIPVWAALQVVSEVAAALFVAYRTRDASGRPIELIHRDIKPSNILLTARGEVKILDFGIARARFEGLQYSKLSVNFGSLGYMSPERFAGVNSPAADVYSLGVVLFEMLTRKRLGKTSTQRASHDRRLRVAHRLITERSPDVTPEVLAFISRLLAFEPADRPTADVAHREAIQLAAAASRHVLRQWTRQRVPGLLQAREIKARAELRTHRWADTVLLETHSVR